MAGRLYEPHVNQRVACSCHPLSPCVALYCSRSDSLFIIFIPLAWSVSRRFLIYWSFVVSDASSQCTLFEKLHVDDECS